MDALKRWWDNDLPRGVKIVFLLLLANAVPAFFILMGLPDRTKTLFVWTIKPEINARLVGAMYSNALLLVAIGMFQTSWARVRVILVVITLFSIMATLLTFKYLDPFLKHPWFHLTYWLGMYFALFFTAPYVFITHERKFGGRCYRRQWPGYAGGHRHDPIHRQETLNFQRIFSFRVMLLWRDLHALYLRQVLLFLATVEHRSQNG